MARHFMTTEQRDECLRAYVLGGFEASRVLAISYGVTPYYIAQLAQRRGFDNNRARRWKNDARWKRAREVGPINTSAAAG